MILMLLEEELRAPRVDQCAVGFHGDAVAADQRHVAVQHIVIPVHESHEVGLEERGRGGGRRSLFVIIRGGECALTQTRSPRHETRMVGPEERHRSEGDPFSGIAQTELPGAIDPTGEHRAILCQDHRVVAASNHLLGDLAVREGRHRGEGVPVRGTAVYGCSPVV